MYKLSLMVLALFAIAFSVMPFSASAAEELPKITKVKNNIYMLVSPKGGNVAVSTGEDGVFLIDDQLTPRSKIINEAIKSITDKDVKFILNTHYHFDHSGGNEFFGEEGAMIVAHDNVRKRLSTEQFITFFKRKMEPLSKAGLPVVTFAHDVTFHYNNDAVHIIHVPNAHTDGDAFAHFVEQNVIATGDLVFIGMYPFVDTGHGGSIKGVIKAQDKIIALSNDKTLIIPGHGPLMDLADLKTYRQALVTITTRIEKAIKAGKTLEQVIEEKPTQEFDASMVSGFIKPGVFVKRVYEDLSR